MTTVSSAPPRRWGIGAAILAVVAGGLSPLAVVPAGVATAAPAACAESRPTALAAAAMAKDCGQRVEVASLRSEAAQTFAKPTGGFVTEESMEPRWSHRPDGSWAEIDTGLAIAADGTVAPKATVVPVVFSGGGTGPLATLRSTDSAGQELSVSWPGGALPTPVLSGDSATYPGVLPGVDLKVTATALGFTEVLVVKDRQAAKNPALAEVELGLVTKGLRTEPTTTGGLVARDVKGAAVFTSPAPLMWDSADTIAAAGKGLAARSAGSTDKPRREARKATMAVKVEAGTLSVTPDRTMVEDPATVYPIYIDPSWSGGLRNNNWTNVLSKFPESTFNQSTSALSDSATWGSAGSGKVCDYYTSGGVCTSTPYVVRSLFQMDISGIRGQNVKKASFLITQKHAWTCGPKSDAKLWRVQNKANGEDFSNTTWNLTNDSNKFSWNESVTAPGNHRADASFGCDGTGTVEFDVTGMAQNAAASGAWSLSVGLRAADEGNVGQWKRFDASSARLAVDYNNPPTMPDWLQVDGNNCGKGANRPVVPTDTPTLSARPWDPDGDTMDVWLGVVKWNGSGWQEPGVAGHQDLIPNGARGYWTTPKLESEGIYAFRAQTNDRGLGGVSPTTPTGDCEFQVDVTDPTVPTVTSAEYPENSVGCAPEGCGSIGYTGRFTFASSPDVVRYRWGFGALTNETAAPSMGAPVTVSWTPPEGTALQQNLSVQAVDHAGRISTKTYPFTLRVPQAAKVQWKLDEVGGTTLVNQQAPGVKDATLQGGALGTAGRIVGGDTALALNGSATNYASAPPVVDTSRSFSVAAWVKVDATGGFRTFVSQCGTVACAYELNYDANADRFAMNLPSEDKTSPSAYYATLSRNAPRLGVWTHLAGVFDAANKTVRLYVNGALDSEQAAPAGWNATGATNIGRSFGGNNIQGGLADVRIWDRVISANEAATTADPQLVGRVAEWRFEEKSGEDAYDSTNYSHHLKLTTTQGATWGAGHDSNGGLHLDGNGYANTVEGPVLNTNQSFTVSAWARPSGTTLPTRNMTLLSQEGARNSAFHLRYRYYNNQANWAFTCTRDDTDSPAFSDALSTGPLTTADLNTWVHLVGVYDAASAQLKLYVNDVLQQTSPCAIWNAGDKFAVGRAKYQGNVVDKWAGDIDEIKVFAGVVVPAKVLTVDGSRTGPVNWVGSSTCAAIPAGDTTDPRGVITWNCNGGDDQRFTYDPDKRTLSALGRCLDVRGSVAANDTVIQMYSCNGTRAQIWTYDPGSQAFQALGMCLDVPNASSDLGLTLELFTCNGSVAQKWRLG
ncbi:MAG: LamG-like jellyroll fold domain-containing protein [Umezawaea sp.]